MVIVMVLHSSCDNIIASYNDQNKSKDTCQSS